MSKVWHRVPLGEILKPVSRPERVDPEKTYRILGEHWYAEGLYVKDTLLGSQIRADKVYRVEKGDFVYNRLFAWKGSFTVATEANAGCYVSNEFPCFAINQEQADSRFLRYYFSRVSAWEEALGLSTGGTPTSRNRLKEEKFLAMEVPLPPRPEQRRIVERIEELAAKINEAHGLRRQAVEGAEALVASVSNELFSEENMRCWPSRSFEEVAEIRSGVTLGRTLRGKTIRLPYLRVANVQDGHLVLNEIKEIDVLEAEAAKWKLIAGDLLLTEGGDWDKLGRGTIWRDEIPTCIHQNHIFRVRTRADEFIPEFLAALVASPIGKAYFQEASKQTTNLASINQRQLKAFRVFQPPLTDQRRIVAELDNLQAQAGALKKLQSATAVELDALLPSILEKAFKGEL